VTCAYGRCWGSNDATAAKAIVKSEKIKMGYKLSNITINEATSLIANLPVPDLFWDTGNGKFGAP
jgi:hypothetical protein